MSRRPTPDPLSPTACSEQLPGWSEGLTRWLIQQAARNAPASLSERLEEEWLADLAERRGTLARMRFGVGCCWATRVIAHEFSASNVLAAASATGNKVMNAYAQHDYSLFSRRTLAFVFIIGLHGMLILALTNGLGHTLIAAIPQNMQMGNIPDVEKLPPQPPPLTPPTFSPPGIIIPRTVVPIDVPTDDEHTIEQVITPPDDYRAPPSTPPHVVNRIAGGPGKGFPNTGDYYPFDAIRSGATGIADVSVCVDEKGRLTAAPAITQTSGSASLDAGALKLAKAGSGHYRATTEDGRPVSSCYPLRIRFDLKN
ncbi:MAG: energy transducer TonB [Steroidobacteraceae bacterium]